MPIVDSGDEADLHDRSRSRSPLDTRAREETDDENLTPTSAKMAKIIGRVVDRKLAPIKKNLNKLLESNSQVRFYSSTDHIEGYSISFFILHPKIIQ